MELPKPTKLYELCPADTKIKGDKNLIINAVDTIKNVKTGSLAFAENPYILQQLCLTNVSAIIVRDSDISGATSNSSRITFCISNNPSELFNQIIKKAFSGIFDQVHFPVESSYSGIESNVSANSFLGKDIKIGRNCKIYPGVFIGNNVIIGDNVIIYPNVYIHDFVIIKDRVTIYPNTVIGSIPNWFYKYNGTYNDFHSPGKVVIGEDVTIGANCCIDRGIVCDTIIENGCRICNLVQIAHGVHISENSLIAPQSGISGNTFVGRNVVVNSQSGVDRNLTIGDNVIVGGKSGVTSSIDDSGEFFGIPAIRKEQYGKLMSAIKQLPRLLSNDIFRIKSDLKERFLILLTEQLSLPKSKIISEEDNISDDLGADSLDIVEIVMALEDEFNIKIPDESIVNIVLTVKNVFWMLLNHIDMSSFYRYLSVTNISTKEAYILIIEKMVKKDNSIKFNKEVDFIKDANMDKLDLLILFACFQYVFLVKYSIEEIDKSTNFQKAFILTKRKIRKGAPVGRC